MTPEQESRLSKARAEAGSLFIVGDIRGLRLLGDALDFEGAEAGKRCDHEYANALLDEVDIIEDSYRFLVAEYAMTTGAGR